jgi:DNA polymerase-3 subunit delta
MTATPYPQLDRLLAATPRQALAPVWLIHGEELLVRQAVDAVVARILEAIDGFNLEVLDGAAVDAGAAIARVNTYGLLPGAKVVVLQNTRAFQSRADGGRLFENARRAFAEGDLPAAARALAAALALENLAPEELGEGGGGALPAGWDAGDDPRWLAALLAHVRATPPEARSAGDEAARLEAALERGFPAGHHLILTADLVDRRRSLYARIEAGGVVVDCTVPAGERKADREAQAEALQRQVRAVLDPRGKRLDRAGFAALCAATGFNLGIFTRNLEILADFVGRREEIRAEDVAAALPRTRRDPLFEFTNAVTDRRWEPAVGLMARLLENEMHPLQVLAAIANQVRRLLAVRGLLERPAGSGWVPGMSFEAFRAQVLPQVAAGDRELLAQAEAWDRALAGDAPPAGRRASKAKAKAAGDLVLAKNPANAFPLYQLFKKAERFTREELEQALIRLSDADLALKSSTVGPRLALERVVWALCRRPA